MSTFTIDGDNNIAVLSSHDQAAAAVTAGAQTFSSQQELTEMAASWPTGRLFEIWNSLPGVKPVKGFKNTRLAVGKIWSRIQRLGGPEKPQPEHKAKVRHAQPAKGASGKAKAHKNSSAANKAAKPLKKAAKKTAVRDGTKTARVVAMLQRKGGATLTQITTKMGWQKHTVRGFMAGTLKKAGFHVESFKPEGGERSYRISQ